LGAEPPVAFSAVTQTDSIERSAPERLRIAEVLVALAGANYAGQVTNAVAEDGVLTGLEASLLHLQGTELVILSACDSGTGEVQIG
jgi:hypothetical protein